MPEQTPPLPISGRNLGPEEIANHMFPSARRGLDPEAVRRFLSEVAAQVRDLRTERAEFRVATHSQQTSPPPATSGETAVDEETFTRILGEEMTRVLQTARESAHAIVSKAERLAAEITADAEKLAHKQKREADESAVATAEHAHAEAAQLVEKTKNECRAMIEEAREARLRVLADLADRRRTLLIQLEQVRAGKESMAAVVESVASKVSESIDTVRAQLLGAEETSRVAADRAAADLEAAIAASEDVDLLAERTLAKIPAAEMSTVPNGPEHLPAAPTNARVFDIEREQSLRPVSVSTVLPARVNEGSISIPSFLRDADASESPLSRAPDSSPTMSQKSGEAVAPERVRDREELLEGTHSASDRADVMDATPEENPVDQLFAKIRASRESKVADAQRVLAHEVGTTSTRHAHSRRRTKEPASSDAVIESSAKSAQPVVESVPTSQAVSSSQTELNAESDPVMHDGPRQRRDSDIESAHLELSRSLKRVLREEQNLLLDALRNRKKNQVLKSLLPSSESRARLIASATPGVLSAYGAGYRYLGEPSSKSPGDLRASEVIENISGRVADELLGALNARLAPWFEKGSDEEGEIAEVVGSAFREWKAARVEALCSDFVIDAFGEGEIAYARSEGIALVWNLDDLGSSCPDCDDNGMAGRVIAGEPFPTGHQHPPVHPGCRCFLTS